MNVVGNRDEYWCLRCVCHTCGTQGVGVVIVREVEGRPEDQPMGDIPLGVDDVLSAHELLRDYAGDVHGLFAGAIGLGGRRPRFAHRSERRFARVLDFYRLRWEYEPHTFPLRWSDDGSPIESFTPDFWLPELGTYLELTTLRQSLVTRKNRKLRRFRELHPDKRVRVFYRRDLEALSAKYARA